MITKKCSQCGKEFTLTEGEVEFYNSKNLHLPKRCKECRDKNKRKSSELKNQNYNSHSPQTYSMGNTANKSKGSNGFNFFKLVPIFVIAVLVVIVLFGVGKNKPSGYGFANQSTLTSHFQDHGREVGAASEADYVAKANAVINNPNSLHKHEAEDGDHVYFNQSTGEIVFLSQRGIIRTYFIADYAYFEST